MLLAGGMVVPAIGPAMAASTANVPTEDGNEIWDEFDTESEFVTIKSNDSSFRGFISGSNDSAYINPAAAELIDWDFENSGSDATSSVVNSGSVAYNTYNSDTVAEFTASGTEFGTNATPIDKYGTWQFAHSHQPNTDDTNATQTTVWLTSDTDQTDGYRITMDAAAAGDGNYTRTLERVIGGTATTMASWDVADRTAEHTYFVERTETDSWTIITDGQISVGSYGENSSNTVSSQTSADLDRKITFVGDSGNRVDNVVATDNDKKVSATKTTTLPSDAEYAFVEVANDDVIDGFDGSIEVVDADNGSNSVLTSETYTTDDNDTQVIKVKITSELQGEKVDLTAFGDEVEVNRFGITYATTSDSSGATDGSSPISNEGIGVIVVVLAGAILVLSRS